MALRPDTHASYRARVSRALAWLEAHVAEDVQAADLARAAAFSPHHFHRVFRGVTGESVRQCTRRLRLESAARQLRRTDHSVLEIALSVGFQSHEGFSRAFRKHFDASPTGYRERPDPHEVAATAHPPLTFAEVQVREVPAFDLICWGHQGSFADVPAAWESFLTAAGAAGLYTGAEVLMGRYPDDPEVTPDGLVRFEVGLLSDAVRPPPPLFRRQIPEGRWAVAIHEGSYDDLHTTYLRLVGGWFPATGTPLGEGPCLERYLNLPHEVPEADLRTEVWTPVGRW